MKQGSCYVLGFQHRCIFPILTFSSSVIILLALRSPDQNPIKLVCNTSVSFVYLIQQYQTLFVPRGYSADLACYFNLCPGLEILLSCTPCCYYCFYLWWLCSLWVYISPTHSFLCHPFRKLQLQTFLSQEVCDCFNLYQFLPFIYFTKLFGLPLKMYNKMDCSDYLVLSRPCTLLGASTTTSKAESWLPSEWGNLISTQSWMEVFVFHFASSWALTWVGCSLALRCSQTLYNPSSPWQPVHYFMWQSS